MRKDDATTGSNDVREKEEIPLQHQEETNSTRGLQLRTAYDWEGKSPVACGPELKKGGQFSVEHFGTAATTVEISATHLVASH